MGKGKKGGWMDKEGSEGGYNDDMKEWKERRKATRVS